MDGIALETRTQDIPHGTLLRAPFRRAAGGTPAFSGGAIVREALLAIGMALVMVGTMVAGSALVDVAAAALLVTASVVCAALSRSAGYLRHHVLDLWAMALVLVALLPRSGAAGAGGAHAHVLTVSTFGLAGGILIGWAAARVALGARTGHGARTGAAASAAVTGLGLIAMLLH